MKKETIQHTIVKYLEGKGFVHGGKVGRDVHDLTDAKEGIIERRCRELAEAGVLERTYEQVEGKGARVVLFRIAPLKIKDGILTGYVGEFRGFVRDSKPLPLFK